MTLPPRPASQRIPRTAREAARQTGREGSKTAEPATATVGPSRGSFAHDGFVRAALYLHRQLRVAFLGQPADLADLVQGGRDEILGAEAQVEDHYLDQAGISEDLLDGHHRRGRVERDTPVERWQLWCSAAAGMPRRGR